MSLASGTRLGPYEVVGPLGAGGMGEVYRARDPRLGRDVAVKVLLTETSQIADRLARFEREARAVAALNHPNILALHDIGNHDGIVYAVMERLEGQTLRDRLDERGPFAPVKALDDGIQMLRGLAAAHERGFIHRDLKPENVFITLEGRVKILDFGLVQQEPPSADEWQTSSTRSVTSPGVVLGTLGYVAPEQVLGQAISCGLLILLSATTWAFVRVMADRAVSAAIEGDLIRAEQLVKRVQRDRLSGLTLTARLVASFPELKALFATDAATIRDFLISYQQRNPEAPILIALDPGGRVIARTDEVDPAGDEGIEALIANRGEPAVIRMRGRVFHAAAAAADAGGHVFGQVIGASPVDDAFAAALREATQDEIVLLSNTGMLASTLRARPEIGTVISGRALRSGQIRWQSRDQWRRAGGGADRSTAISIGV